MARRSTILTALTVLLVATMAWPVQSGRVQASQRGAAASPAKLKCKYGTKTVTKKVHGKKTRVKVCKSKPAATPVPTDTPTATPTPTTVPTSTFTPTVAATKVVARAIPVTPTQKTAPPANPPLAVGTHATYPLGPGPSGIATGDFNRDGKTDVAVIESKTNTLSILLSDSTGKLQPKVDYPTGKKPASLVVADLNGDGIPEVAVANSGSNSIGIYLNQGNGTFSAPPAAAARRASARAGSQGAVPAGQPRDGKTGYILDLLCSPSQMVVSEWLRRDTVITSCDSPGGVGLFQTFAQAANGEFQTKSTYDFKGVFGWNPQAFTTFNVAGMGPEVAVIGSDSGAAPATNLAVLPVGVDGTISTPANPVFWTFPGFKLPDTPQILPSVKVASDGGLSLAWSDTGLGDNTSSIIIAQSTDGGVTFPSFTQYATHLAGGVQIATGDVNGDGFADIIAVSGAGAGPHVQVFDGNPTFSSLTTQPFDLSGFPNQTLASDLRVAWDVTSGYLIMASTTEGLGQLFEAQLRAAPIFTSLSISYVGNNDNHIVLTMNPFWGASGGGPPLYGIEFDGGPFGTPLGGPFVKPPIYRVNALTGGVGITLADSTSIPSLMDLTIGDYHAPISGETIIVKSYDVEKRQVTYQNYVVP